MTQEFDPERYQEDRREAKEMNRHIREAGDKYMWETANNIDREYRNMLGELEKEKEKLISIRDHLVTFIDSRSDIVDPRMSFSEFLDVIDKDTEIFGGIEYTRMHELLDSKIIKFNLEASLQDFVNKLDSRIEEIREMFDPGPEAPNLDIEQK